jgi:di/tricarboxylate transporter
MMTASNPIISMIVGPANYSSRQLWRIGGPLSLIYITITVLVVNLMFWWQARGG